MRIRNLFALALIFLAGVSAMAQSSHRSTCAPCGGNGRIVVTETVPCFPCHGTGNLTCIRCGGRGGYYAGPWGVWQSCWSCGGNGVLYCSTCNGTGTREVRHTEKCRTCEGTGH